MKFPAMQTTVQQHGLGKVVLINWKGHTAWGIIAKGGDTVMLAFLTSPASDVVPFSYTNVEIRDLSAEHCMDPGSAIALVPDLSSAVYGKIADYRRPGMMALLEKRFCVCTFHAQSPSTKIWIELDTGRTRGLSRVSGLCFFSRWEVVSCWPKNNPTERLFGFPTE